MVDVQIVGRICQESVTEDSFAVDSRYCINMRPFFVLKNTPTMLNESVQSRRRECHLIIASEHHLNVPGAEYSALVHCQSKCFIFIEKYFLRCHFSTIHITTIVRRIDDTGEHALLGTERRFSYPNEIGFGSSTPSRDAAATGFPSKPWIVISYELHDRRKECT